MARLLLVSWSLGVGSAFSYPVEPVAQSEEPSQTAEDAGDAEDSTSSDPQTADPNAPDPNAPDPTGDSFHLGGALRFNGFYKSWVGEEANRNRGGDFAFDTARVNVDGSRKGVDLSLEYRFYSGYNMLHHGYVGYTFANGTELQVGVHRNPFGLLPYASHNWFFNIGYYLGMEDDYDLGVKVILPRDPWNLQLAFYKNDEGHYTGDSLDSARYSYDVVHSNPSELGDPAITIPTTNEEVNQGNARLTYTLDHGPIGSTEFGLSGEYGGLYNATTARMGKRWATAMHVNGNYGRFNLMLEYLRYNFRPENPAGQDDRFMILGAYDAPYKVASEGSIVMVNLAYRLPVPLAPLEALTFYNNYSYLGKAEPGFTDSQQNVLGVLISAGNLLTYVDFAFGKNHPWLGPNYTSALAEGDPTAEWEMRFNINIGYYF